MAGQISSGGMLPGQTSLGGIDAYVVKIAPFNQPPDCSGAIIADQTADATCQATISEADVTGVIDPEGDPLTITVNPTILSLGANTLTVTADDGNGGICSIDISVNVDDITAPVADLATLVDVTAECEVTSLTPPIATDNCGTVTVTNDATLPISGTTVVTWTYDDGNGNTTNQTQNVVIDDTILPVITCPADITQTADAGNCSAVVTYIAPIGSDNCTGPSTIQTAGLASGEAYPVGTTTNTFEVIDAAGNTAIVVLMSQ